MRRTVQLFKALSDETRLRVLCLLMQRECCVCEVMQALDISQTRASRNLNILQDAGFLRSRREGQWSLYAIDRAGMAAHLPLLLRAVRKSMEGNDVSARDAERLKKATRTGLCGIRQCLTTADFDSHDAGMHSDSPAGEKHD